MAALLDGIFWGGLLIVLGLGLILNNMYHFRFPVFKILLAAFFFYLGIKILIGGFGVKERNNVVFAESKMEYQKGLKEYNVVFGSSIVDLTDVAPDGKDEKVKVAAVFGSAIVKLREGQAVIINGDSVFSSVIYPDSTRLSFGTHSYKSKSYDESDVALKIKVDSVFASVEIRNVSTD